MKNQLVLQIAGVNYMLKFNVGTYANVKRITGQDPFKFAATSEEYEDVMAFSKVVFQAALASGSLLPEEKLKALTDGVWIDELMLELTGADLSLIVNMYTNPADSKPSVNGEVVKNTQQGDHVG